MNENLKTSQPGLELITKWESCVLTPYVCPAGKLTVGVGHVVMPGEDFSKGITKEQAMELLRKDVGRFEKGVYRNITVELNQNQFDALVCFTFNVGEGGLVNTGVQRAVNASNFGDVPAALEQWAKARVNGVLKVLPGLLARRKSEGELFMRPLGWVAPAMVPWTKASLTEAQTKLQRLGLYTSKIDGLWGPGTEQAIRAFANRSFTSAGKNPKAGVPQGFLDALASA